MTAALKALMERLKAAASTLGLQVDHVQQVTLDGPLDQPRPPSPVMAAARAMPAPQATAAAEDVTAELRPTTSSSRDDRRGSSRTHSLRRFAPSVASTVGMEPGENRVPDSECASYYPHAIIPRRCSMGRCRRKPSDRDVRGQTRFDDAAGNCCFAQRCRAFDDGRIFLLSALG